MQKLTVTLEPYAALQGATLARFAGDFDGGAKESIQPVQDFVDKSPLATTLLCDFSRLNFLNSYAIGHLVAWHNHLAKSGGRLAIVGAGKNVEDIFSIVGLGHIFKIFPTLAAAESGLKA